ncbi:NAD(P)-dependent oxidoreductase, partial [bacterium]|nr:NAD(P)-dependent oxidoreductase [bacterium]
MGRHIVMALAAAGWHVVALDTAFDAALEYAWDRQPTIELMTGDASALPSVKLQALVHAAAITRMPSDEDGDTPEQNLKENLEPVLALLAWAHQQHLRRAIFISSDAIYSTKRPGAIDEREPPTPLGTYASAKAATESMVVTLREVYGRDVIAARLSGVYGSGEQSRASRPRVSPVLRMIQSAYERGSVQVERLSASRAWTYAEDIGTAIEALLKVSALNHAVYNIATEECLTDAQMAQALQQHLPHLQIEYVDSGQDARPQSYLSHARLR